MTPDLQDEDPIVQESLPPVPPVPATPIEKLEAHLKAGLGKHYVISTSEATLKAARAEVVDLAVWNTPVGLRGSFYGFIAARLRDDIQALLKSSPVEVVIKGSHMRPDGR